MDARSDEEPTGSVALPENSLATDTDVPLGVRDPLTPQDENNNSTNPKNKSLRALWDEYAGFVLSQQLVLRSARLLTYTSQAANLQSKIESARKTLIHLPAAAELLTRLEPISRHATKIATAKKTARSAIDLGDEAREAWLAQALRASGTAKKSLEAVAAATMVSARDLYQIYAIPPREDREMIGKIGAAFAAIDGAITTAILPSAANQSVQNKLVLLQAIFKESYNSVRDSFENELTHLIPSSSPALFAENVAASYLSGTPFQDHWNSLDESLLKIHFDLHFNTAIQAEDGKITQSSQGSNKMTMLDIVLHEQRVSRYSARAPEGEIIPVEKKEEEAEEATKDIVSLVFVRMHPAFRKDLDYFSLVSFVRRHTLR